MKTQNVFMRNILNPALCCAFAFLACNGNIEKEEVSMEKWKEEIRAVEREFAEMADKEGIPAAFLKYAAEDAVLLRNDKLILGKEALRASYAGHKQGSGGVSLSWAPDFVDVSSSGDLGYTYGKYTYITTDSAGTKNAVEGIFHTVWKRQADGSWRFVWD
jgi:ketosteroid isomerase-like protein